ncbi:MAG: anhydro-N-acetylmuramic acid kinase [Nevskiaceae bacterium]|nr:MAG: anhydro-N-acetylmuramic acid kinase [Nevskiaceae bacterium]
MRTLAIGLISGTSMDGVDAALCAFEGSRFASLMATHATPYPDALRQRLLRLQRDEPAIPLREYAELDNAVADVFTDAAKALLHAAGAAPNQVRAIGSHGQTVFHDPRGVGSSLQLGNPNRIAARSGLTTVADFRRKDIALGGEGAPLVPAFHQAVFADAGESRCVVNIGGIANVTCLPRHDDVRGFDTGPGNGLMDEWIHQHRGEAYDRDGDYAASGTLLQPLLDALLSDPYFALPPPKSTGRGQFNLDWVRQRFVGLDALRPEDVQRTLCELTARSIGDAVRGHAPEARRLLVCGGGARNRMLMGRLAALTGLPVETTGAHGLDADWVEAAAFAWLAVQTLDGLPGNLPTVTGATARTILGGIYRA